MSLDQLHFCCNGYMHACTEYHGIPTITRKMIIINGVSLHEWLSDQADEKVDNFLSI